MMGTCGRSSGPNKHCSFPCISCQLLSLLYQDVCPTIRPITFDILFELQSRQEESTWENCYSYLCRERQGNGLGEGSLRSALLVSCWVTASEGKGSGTLKPTVKGKEAFCVMLRGPRARAQALEGMESDLYLLLAVRDLGQVVELLLALVS